MPGALELDCEVPVEYFPTSEIARINLKHVIKAQENVTLFIEFSGQLSEHLSGFFRTKCLNKDGKVELVGATQFEVSLEPFHAPQCYQMDILQR